MRKDICKFVLFFIIPLFFYSTITAQTLNTFHKITFLTTSNASTFYSQKTPALNRLNYSSSNSSSLVLSNADSPDLRLFGNLGNNIINSFKGDNLYLHLAGIASSYLLVSSNTDYKVEKFFNEHEGYGNAARPAIRMAMFFPFVISGSLYAYGKFAKDNEAVGASFAVLQSSLLAFLYNSLLKAVTGRPHPDWRNSNDMQSLSKTFRFGFMRGGIFWGWPSGHTSSTMAVVSALTNFYPEKTWLKIAGYSYVAYMIFSVSSLNRGGMHWLSDAIAAAFMSYAIGSTVGKYYRSLFKTSSKGDLVSPGMNPYLLSFKISF